VKFGELVDYGPEKSRLNFRMLGLMLELGRARVSAPAARRGATTFSKLGVQFLGLGYCTEQNTDIIPSFVHSSRLYNGNHSLHQKSWGGPSKFWGSGPLRPPVVAPLAARRQWSIDVKS